MPSGPGERYDFFLSRRGLVAAIAQEAEERHVVILRCEDVPVEGLLADVVYQDLVGVAEPDERKRRIMPSDGSAHGVSRPVCARAHPYDTGRERG